MCGKSEAGMRGVVTHRSRNKLRTAGDPRAAARPSASSTRLRLPKSLSTYFREQASFDLTRQETRRRIGGSIPSQISPYPSRKPFHACGGNLKGKPPDPKTAIYDFG